MAAKYDIIGTGYNTTRTADPFLTQRLLEHLQPFPQGIYLDIGCGTGNYTHALAAQGLHFIGIDPSEKMLRQAKTSNETIAWKLGSVETIPLPDNDVDGAIGTLTIHHWSDLDQGFSELHRVVKPDGIIVIFTSTPEQMEGYWLNHYFPKMLKESMHQMPSLERVKNAMKNGGFINSGVEKYFIQPDLQDQFLYIGKHQPELYFKETIRNGISSFSSLAHKSEIDQGLSQLRKDIASGVFQTIARKYANRFGDYIFIIGKNSPN